ncbi:hypothetical protein DSUL_50124 [Desulfovibrionales bacterium]
MFFCANKGMVLPFLGYGFHGFSMFIKSLLLINCCCKESSIKYIVPIFLIAIRYSVHFLQRLAHGVSVSEYAIRCSSSCYRLICSLVKRVFLSTLALFQRNE